MQKRIELIVMGLTFTFSITAGILDWLELFPLPPNTISSLTLIGIGLIAGYLVLERRNKLDEIEKNLKKHDTDVFEAFSKTISSLNGVEVTKFSDGVKFIDYFFSRVKKAKRVNDTTWQEEVRIITHQERETFNKYRDIVAEVAKKPDAIWREVVIFTTKSRFDRISKQLNTDLPGYSAVFYDPPKKNSPPMISFATIDNEEVFLAGQEYRIAIRHPEIVKYFSEYYERIWNLGSPLKIGTKIHSENLKKIIDSFPNADNKQT